MKLYFTPGSPYARMPRIVVIEKALQHRVEMEVARTREPSSPFYTINPSGRVPYLVSDDGTGMEGSMLICDYLDGIDGQPALGMPPQPDAWEGRRLEASAQSTLEGLALWARELRRPANERSPVVIAHETARAERLLDAWETLSGHPLLVGPLNMLQIVLGCSLGLEMRTLGTAWQGSHPKLARWHVAIERRPSFIATRPPPTGA